MYIMNIGFCRICGKQDKIYADGMCSRCYFRLKKREWRRRNRKKNVLEHYLRMVDEYIGIECPICHNTHYFLVDFDRCELVCRVCGTVLRQGASFKMLYPTPERNYP